VARVIRTVNRKYATVAFLVFLASALAAIVLAVLSVEKSQDAELIRSAAEVTGLIHRIYEYRRATGKYPDSLVELRPIAGDVISKHERDYSGREDDYCYCGNWCWTYWYKPGVVPPLLKRYVGNHGDLTYNFAPSGFPVPKNAVGYPDEGWVVTSEGNARYLRSFFGKIGDPAGR
jgi:hypothetical protein